jgi:membrane associated rhomboid family serine protease
VSATTPSPRDERTAGFQLVGGMVALMWIVEVVNSIDDQKLDQYGIKPREADGLIGVVTAPFLHASWGHLIGNTIPFLVMGLAIALRGLGRVAMVTAIVAVVGGLGTWLIGPDHSDHIGASGIVFGYAGFLVSRGIFNRSVSDLLIGAVVVAVWGTALLSGFAPHPGVSWQGHLCGAIGGLIAARVMMGRGEEGKKAAPAV